MTQSSNSGGRDPGRFPERDWKHLRAVHTVALDRFCSRAIRECKAILEEGDLTAHERYLRLFRLLRERDAELAGAFDDLRRSRAIARLAAMIMLDVVTTDELEQFSPRVRESARAMAEIYSEK